MKKQMPLKYILFTTPVVVNTKKIYYTTFCEYTFNWQRIKIIEENDYKYRNKHKFFLETFLNLTKKYIELLKLYLFYHPSSSIKKKKEKKKMFEIIIEQI
jgi:hypothetical protein